jgi:hypothetical protein
MRLFYDTVVLAPRRCNLRNNKRCHGYPDNAQFQAEGAGKNLLTTKISQSLSSNNDGGATPWTVNSTGVCTGLLVAPLAVILMMALYLPTPRALVL